MKVLLVSNSHLFPVVGDCQAAKPSARTPTTAEYGFERERFFLRTPATA
ncbi:MAG: hypothetical protein ABI863_15915 [Ginsengibacter sp.]